jgi:hypothetical protein
MKIPRPLSQATALSPLTYYLTFPPRLSLFTYSSTIFSKLSPRFQSECTFTLHRSQRLAFSFNSRSPFTTSGTQNQEWLCWRRPVTIYPKPKRDLSLLSWICRQQISPKHRYLSTRLYGITSHKTVLPDLTRWRCNNALDSHSGDARFKSRQRHRLHWLDFRVRKMLR